MPLVRALERSGAGQGKLLGVIVLTDGRHNAGDPPVKKALELGEREVPIFPVILGAGTAAARRGHPVRQGAARRVQGRLGRRGRAL